MEVSPMYKATVRRKVRRNVQSLRDGNPEPLLAGFADDAVLVFPGHSSWAGEYRGKPAIARFLRRFVDTGLGGETDEILVNGPPWRMRVGVLFTDRARDAEGHVVYENRAMLFVKARWGKVVYQEDFLDTQRVESFDAYLAGVTA
jgi:ketosteroid isomerase-like protein